MDRVAPSEKRRRRPPLACIACRRRKVRCDRRLPCQNCVKARRTTSCAYAPDDRLEPRESGVPVQGPNDGPNNHGPRSCTEADGAASLPYLSPATTTTTMATTAGGGHSTNPQAASSSSSNEEASALAERVRQLEKQLAQVLGSKESGAAGTKLAPGIQTNPATGTAQSQGNERWQKHDTSQNAQYLTGDASSARVMLAKSRYLGSSHWMHGVTLVSSLYLFSLFRRDIRL